MEKSYYEVLGINENSTLEDARKAFLKIVKKYHPDNFINADEETRIKAEKEFRMVKDAYENIKKEKQALNQTSYKKFSGFENFDDNNIDCLGFDRFQQTYAELKNDLDKYNLKINPKYLDIQNRGKISINEFWQLTEKIKKTIKQAEFLSKLKVEKKYDEMIFYAEIAQVIYHNHNIDMDLKKYFDKSKDNVTFEELEELIMSLQNQLSAFFEENRKNIMIEIMKIEEQFNYLNLTEKDINYENLSEAELNIILINLKEFINDPKLAQLQNYPKIFRTIKMQLRLYKNSVNDLVEEISSLCNYEISEKLKRLSYEDLDNIKNNLLADINLETDKKAM